MKKRRVLALVLAATMVMGSSMTVFAGEGDGEETPAGTGNKTVEGTGDVSYVDTTVYEVALPTSASLTLIVDPQGLTGMTGTTATEEDLAEYAGKIKCSTTSVVTNKSSVPMKVTLKMKVKGNATIVDDKDNVEDKTTKKDNVLLYAVPSSADLVGDEAKYVAASKGVVLGATDTTVDFVLAKAAYNYTKADNSGTTVYDYEIAANENGHSTGIRFEGAVNKYADWTDYKNGGSKTIGMEAVFSYAPAADTDVADATTDAYGMMALPSGAKTVTLTPPNAAPSIATTSYPLVQDQAIVIPVNLGSGTLKATGLTAANFGSSNFLGQTVTFDAATNKITVNVAAVNAMRGMSGDQTITMVFNDGKTSVPITFTH